MRRTFALILTATVAVLTGCSGGSTPGASPSTSASANRTPYVFATPPPVSDPALTADGLGPIRLGIPAAEAAGHGWAVRDPRCGWRTSPDLLADGVELYFGDDRISEIWLGNATHSTSEGARVGMDLEQIESLYAGDLAYERRGSVGGQVILPVVRLGERELLFFGLGDENATPGPRAPLTGIAARAYGTGLSRPSC